MDCWRNVLFMSCVCFFCNIHRRSRRSYAISVLHEGLAQVSSVTLIFISRIFLYCCSFFRSILFGSIGMIIGHEMTHAFDNKGRFYDKSGSLQNWWTNTTIDRFDERTACFVRQYNKFNFQTVNVSSILTLRFFFSSFPRPFAWARLERYLILSKAFHLSKGTRHKNVWWKDYLSSPLVMGGKEEIFLWKWSAKMFIQYLLLLPSPLHSWIIIEQTP